MFLFTVFIAGHPCSAFINVRMLCIFMWAYIFKQFCDRDCRKSTKDKTWVVSETRDRALGAS